MTKFLRQFYHFSTFVSIPFTDNCGRTRDSGNRDFLRRHCYDFWQPAGFRASKAKEPYSGHLSDNAVFTRNGELSAGLCPSTVALVCGTDNRVAACTDYGCQSGCDSADFHSCGTTRTCLRLPQHLPVFHHPHRSIPWRLCGGQYL